MKKIFFNLVLITLSQYAFGQTTTFYDFNTPGQLSSLFNGVGATGSVSQLTAGGIGNSGGINLPGGTNAIFSTKEGYSLGPAGSSDTFESFIKSEGPNGYSGVGFTASVPVSASSDGFYRPTDAIGISAHGGGFIFHNGATNYTGNWTGSSLSSGITATKVSSVSNLLGEGSAFDWYKIIFKMTRATLTTFNLRVEIWTSDASGIMLESTASAIFEVNGVTNATIANAPILHSYFNFAGDRVRNLDNFSINLTGGGSVIQAGAPVILTSSASESNGVITANGNVSSENGGTVTERGFVYATTVDPTIADNKVVDSGSGLGTFTGSISGLSVATTYYLRAYATNSVGTTSYGSDLSFTTLSVLNKYGGFTLDASLAVDKYGAIGSGKGISRFGGIIDAPLASPKVIGDAYQGGIIAYILVSGDAGYDPTVQHGLIAATADIGPVSWNNGSNISTTAQGTAIGTGSANTNSIITAFGVGTYAASIAKAYSVAGYTSGWYLPSRDEFQKLYTNRVLIGNFNFALEYWTSTDPINLGWATAWSGSTFDDLDAFRPMQVRPVRSF
ncbi:hypothetical protein [Flavobacterium sp. W22_SRS_FP1]|uniref:hypothetical protein n=1 Tax=Flavobacterium sp. W22_SRS_FP1 TaxID=3240276 RepID=UPI003F90A060